MKRFFCFSITAAVILFSSMLNAATVDNLGGISLSLSYNGDIDDAVTDSSGTVWATGRDKLEEDLNFFAENLWQLSEQSNFLKNVLIIDASATGSVRAWEYADIQWTPADAFDFSASVGGWSSVAGHISIRGGLKDHVANNLLHELGHYFYGLDDEYTRDISSGYYLGYWDTLADIFSVGINDQCDHTIMQTYTSTRPHQLCDGTDHEIELEYPDPDNPGSNLIQVLTPAVIDDGNPDNDAPLNYFTQALFANHGWAIACMKQINMCDLHIDGTRPIADLDAMPEPSFVYVEKDAAAPGRVILIDRSGSMGYMSHGRQAVDYVQETALFLYHSAEMSDFVGAAGYNASTEPLFDYDLYDDENTIVSFYDATGLTNIHRAIEFALDELEDTHGDGLIAGAEIFLMSDGNQTTGSDLWDQVDRAVENNVRIYTFEFGDTDHVVMQEIASRTSGESFPMFERDDSANHLKLEMVKALAKVQGLKEIYSTYGKLNVTGHDENGLYHGISFRVPIDSNDVRFYVIPQTGHAADYSFGLKDSSGDLYSSYSSSIQSKGRFLGRKVSNPRFGEYNVRIRSKKDRFSKEPVQLLAFANNHNMEFHTWTEDTIINAADQKTVVIHASATNKYPLTNVGVRAFLYSPKGDLITTLTLNDKGKNGDAIKGDGLYAGLLDTYWLRKSEVDTFGLKTRFEVTHDAMPAPNARWSSLENYKEILSNFKPDKFSSYAETVRRVTYKAQDTYTPILDTSNWKHAEVDPGKVYRDTFTICNTVTDAEHLRINLGRNIKVLGVKAEICSSEKINNKGTCCTTYHVTYRIDRKAAKGYRDLRLQFGDTILTQRGLVHIH